MRLLMLLLVVLAGYTVAGDAQETDGAAIELNPLDFVPLEVGNRWVYRHSYNNGMYYAWDDFWRRHGLPSDEEEEIAYWEAYFKQFEIPGYPFGESSPPRSSTDTYPDDPTLVVEVTHTEWIDGFEYFVFSEAPYDWPPLPAFFWAGQKVRLSEDGMLLFHRNGTDIPLYDFSPQYEDIEIPAEWYSTSTEYVPVRAGRWMSDRLFYPDHTDVIINPAYRDQTLEVGFHFSNPMEYLTGWSVRFVKGYGIGLVRREVFGTGTSLLFWNSLSPISAILSGKEVSYEEATGKFVGEPDFSSILGQLGKISINNGGFTVSGFDFSEGTKSEYFFGEKKEGDLEAYQSTWDGFASTSPYLISYIGMADLGRVDFGRLVSEGPADLRPDPPSCSWRTAPPFCPEGPADLRPDPSTSDDLRWRKVPQEGDTYAIWTQEGGIALMHILDVKHTWRRTVLYILFDYVYYPASDRSPEKTSVQPTSWGQLKQLFLQDSPIKTEE